MLATYDVVMASHRLDDPIALSGRWQFERTITDRVVHEESRVVGHTELTCEASDRIRWSEKGTLHWRDKAIPVSRVLFLQLRGRDWFVTFDDGREFHPWAPGEAVEHECGADLYRGHIDSSGPGLRRWNVEWHVSGPQKDYTMTTLLTRLPAPD